MLNCIGLDTKAKALRSYPTPKKMQDLSLRSTVYENCHRFSCAVYTTGSIEYYPTNTNVWVHNPWVQLRQIFSPDRQVVKHYTDCKHRVAGMNVQSRERPFLIDRRQIRKHANGQWIWGYQMFKYTNKFMFFLKLVPYRLYRSMHWR